MEEEEESIFVDSMVRDFHIYKDVCNPVVGDILMCQREFGNFHDPYAVTVVCEDAVIVGHIPRTIPSLHYFFLREN